MKKSILLCAVLVALTACNGNSDNNKSLDYETLDVNFTLKSDLEIPDGTEFGVVAQCARDGQQGVNMCSKSVALYKASGTLSPQRLSAMSEEDKILARESDHGFSFMQYPLIGTMLTFLQCRCHFLRYKTIQKEYLDIFLWLLQ